MFKLRISRHIVNEVYLRELYGREGEGMSVYDKIVNAKPQSDKSRVIEVTPTELNEIYLEADYWSGDYEEYSMPKNEWLAYRALSKKCRELMNQTTEGGHNA